jgi:hypothetical protein
MESIRFIQRSARNFSFSAPLKVRLLTQDFGTLPHRGLRFYGTLRIFSKLFATVFLDTLAAAHG